MTDYINLSDEELVKGFVSGNHKYFDVIFERHKQKVYSYIFIMVKQEDISEDIFQETFVKVHSNLINKKYTESGRFVSWVMRIAHNLVIDHFRKKKSEAIIYNEDYERDLFNQQRFSDATIEENLVKSEVYYAINELVDSLSDSQREIIKMRHFMGLSFKEIAEETNVSINTALGRMRYALINLRKLVEEKNISLSF